MVDLSDESIRKRVDFLVYIKEMKTVMDECIANLSPEKSLEYKINIGLMTKLRKLSESISNNINNADSLSTHILMRSFNEAAISLRYLLLKRKGSEKRKKYKEFVRTDAMRRRDQVKNLRANQVFLDMSGPPHIDDIISSIIESIKEDGFDIETLPKPPAGGSWHQGKSYLDMASSLDAMSFMSFGMLYGGESESVHPNWSEIKRNHIKPVEPNTKLFEPNLQNSTIAFFAEYSVLICQGLKVTEDFTRVLIDEGRAMEISQLHETFHRRHTFGSAKPHNTYEGWGFIRFK